jgi:hypothetical protein
MRLVINDGSHRFGAVQPLGPIDGTGCYRGRAIIHCPDCGAVAYLIGHWSAAGQTLPSGYTPRAGELVRIEVIRCLDCGIVQVS